MKRLLIKIKELLGLDLTMDEIKYLAECERMKNIPNRKLEYKQIIEMIASVMSENGNKTHKWIVYHENIQKLQKQGFKFERHLDDPQYKHYHYVISWE